MSDFPRTQIEDVSVPRLIIGTNWFMGFSHTSAAQSKFIKQHQDRGRLADILEVFMAEGIDAILGGRPEDTHLLDAIRDAEDRTGRKLVWIGTPSLDTAGLDTASKDENLRILDAFAEKGCKVCMPHQNTTDALLDRTNRTIRGMDAICAAIRERGMIPGLSTHMPETPLYADEAGLDVATYIQMYNAAGFLMQIETDWVHRMIWQRQKPVITIKPLAAGRLQPLVGLAFSWATIRDIDMVCVGCFTPDEAREVISISRTQLARQGSTVDLQETRSKASVKPKCG